MKNVLQDTFNWFSKARPSSTSKDVHSQLGCHFEEVGEMIDELEGKDEHTKILLMAARLAVRDLANHLKQNDKIISIHRPVDYLDAICDQIVTATGCAELQGYDLIGALNEVNRANYSKFDDNGKPIFDENKKVTKGPRYLKANLNYFI